ncbi:MAG: hypothetical protein QXW70_03475 [Candidatus Anstonellales archaeon]
MNLLKKKEVGKYPVYENKRDSFIRRFYYKHIDSQGELGSQANAFEKGIIKRLYDNPKVVKVLLKVAKRVGNNTLLKVLYKPDISEMFINNPEKVSKILLKIAKNAGEHAIKAIDLLGDDVRSPIFVKNPRVFVEIAKIARKRTPLAFEALSTKEIANICSYPSSNLELFLEFLKVVTKPGIFGESRRKEENREYLLKVISSEGAARLYENYLWALLEIAKVSARRIYSGDSILGGINYEDVSQLVERFPWAVVEIEKVIKKKIYKQIYWYIIYGKCGSKMRSIFEKHPKPFVEILKATGGRLEGVRALDLLYEKPLAPLFDEYPWAFVEIARIARKKTEVAFRYLASESLSDSERVDLIENPNELMRRV